MLISSLYLRKDVFRLPLVRGPMEILRGKSPGSMPEPVILRRCRMPRLEEWWRGTFLLRRSAEQSGRVCT